MHWTKIDFGKYEGKTLPEVIFSDPDYFVWGFDNGIFSKNSELEKNAEFLYERIRSIKIPDNLNGNVVSEYCINPTTSEFDILRIVPIDSPKDHLVLYRGSIIDLSFPRQYSYVARNVTNRFLNQLFFILFNNFNYKPPKEECENFFNNDENFGV